MFTGQPMDRGRGHKLTPTIITRLASRLANPRNGILDTFKCIQSRANSFDDKIIKSWKWISDQS